MIDPKEYPFHVELLGGEEEFNEYIKNWKEYASWDNEEHIKMILDGEEKAKVGSSMWSNPWMP